MTATVIGAHMIEARRQNFLQEHREVAGPFEKLDEAWAAKKRLEQAPEYRGCVLRVKTKYKRLPKPRKAAAP